MLSYIMRCAAHLNHLQGSSPGEFVINAYPVAVEATDIVIIFFTVSLIGFLAVLYPVNTLRKKLLQN